MEREGKCSECNYWLRVDENQGECRFNPPPVTTSPNHPDDRWPHTLGDDWCGRFGKPKQAPFLASGEIQGVKYKK